MSKQEIPVSLNKKEGRDIRPSLASRRRQDQATGRTFFVITVLPIVLVVVIAIALAMRFWPILKEYSLWELVSGAVWKPGQGKFGFWPFISGTFWVTIVGVVLAVVVTIGPEAKSSEFTGRS